MSKYKLAKKAYWVDAHDIDEGYLADQECWISYAGSQGKAKVELFKEVVTYGGFEKLRLGDEITFLNLPVRRHKSMDLFEFEGMELNIYRIDEILEERKRLGKLDLMLLDQTIEYCYIRKGSYYRPNSCGYTEMLHRAGVYTKVDAVSHAKSCSELSIIPINIDEHNKMIQGEIDELKTRLLKKLCDE